MSRRWGARGRVLVASFLFGGECLASLPGELGNDIELRAQARRIGAAGEEPRILREVVGKPTETGPLGLSVQRRDWLIQARNELCGWARASLDDLLPVLDVLGHFEQQSDAIRLPQWRRTVQMV